MKERSRCDYYFNEIYTEGLLKILDRITARQPDEVVFPGRSASKMGEDLEKMAGLLGRSLPSCRPLDHLTSCRISHGYEEEPGVIAELIHPNRDVIIVEDFALSGCKLGNLKGNIEEAERNAGILCLASRWPDTDGQLGIEVIVRDNPGLVAWLRRRKSL